MIDCTIIEKPAPVGRSNRKRGLARIDHDELSYFIEGEPIPAESLSVEGKCSTGKDTYPTYKAAQKALRQKSPTGRRTKVIYKCSFCGCYHFTTKDGQFHHYKRPYDRQREKEYERKIVETVAERSGKVKGGGFVMKRYKNLEHQQNLSFKESA